MNDSPNWAWFAMGILCGLLILVAMMGSLG